MNWVQLHQQTGKKLAHPRTLLRASAKELDFHSISIFCLNIWSWRYKVLCTQRDQIRSHRDINSGTLYVIQLMWCKTHSHSVTSCADRRSLKGDTVLESRYTCSKKSRYRFCSIFLKIAISISISIIITSLVRTKFLK